jgi:hypothetical protein
MKKAAIITAIIAAGIYALVGACQRDGFCDFFALAMKLHLI